MTTLNAPYFKDDQKARVYLESVRWPNGPICPHCGSAEVPYALKGKAHRPGLYKCRDKDCRMQFSVTVGTVFERSKIPLSKWLTAAFLLCSSKKGMSAHQLHRVMGVTYKTAWFLAHRIRHAMETQPNGLMGFGGGFVEVDETFIGNDRTIKPKHQKKGRGYHHKYKVLSLVDRETGKARSVVLDNLKASTIAPILRANVSKDATLMTDEAFYYTKIGREFAAHNSVNHNDGECGRGSSHTNTVEGFFSVFKRGMKGVYQHCQSKHLHRYLAEFDFRYNHRSSLGIEDGQRVIDALNGIEGKRLTYRSAD